MITMMMIIIIIIIIIIIPKGLLQTLQHASVDCIVKLYIAFVLVPL